MEAKSIKRKSPIKHHVRKYQRQTGTAVDDYDRGHGTRKVKVSQPRLHKQEPLTRNQYSVHIIYGERDSETFTIPASSYPEAIENALSKRIHITPPYQVKVDKL